MRNWSSKSSPTGRMVTWSTPRVDKSSDAFDAMFDGSAGGPDFDTLPRKVFLVIGVEKSISFAKRLISIPVHADTVV